MNDEMKIGQELLDEATLEEIRQLPPPVHSGKSRLIAVFGAGYALQSGRLLTMRELSAFWRNLK